MALLVASYWLYRRWSKGLMIRVRVGRAKAGRGPRRGQEPPVQVRMLSQRGTQTGGNTDEHGAPEPARATCQPSYDLCIQVSAPSVSLDVFNLTKGFLSASWNPLRDDLNRRRTHHLHKMTNQTSVLPPMATRRHQQKQMAPSSNPSLWTPTILSSTCSKKSWASYRKMRRKMPS